MVVDEFFNWCYVIILEYYVFVSGYDSLKLMFFVKIIIGNFCDYELVFWIVNFEGN